MSGGGSVQEIENQAKELYTQYKSQYMPQDNYQKKRDEEAQRLKSLVMGNRLIMGEDDNEDNHKYLL